ncbi:MAG: PepSY domain-containing protein [Eubacterium sp.]
MTNKKRLAIILATVIAVLIAACAGMFAYASDVAKKNSIGIDNAINIAMTDAGASEENSIITKAKMDFEKGVFVYDIEFSVTGAGEYDYSIKASDGTILEKDLDNDKKVNTSAAETTSVANSQAVSESTTGIKENAVTKTTAGAKDNKTTTTAKSSTDITLEKAKSIALKDSGESAKNVKFTETKKDFDDGITYYDIEFKTSSYKYEYEIDLKGNILSYDKDPIKKKTTTTKQNTTSNKQYIGVDKAKSTALNHAGLSASKVSFTKAKLEKEDGIYIYEIEFVSSGIEYEYEINATTGKIVSHSSEPYDD